MAIDPDYRTDVVLASTSRSSDAGHLSAADISAIALDAQLGQRRPS